MRLQKLAPLLFLAACSKKVATDDESNLDSGLSTTDTGNVVLLDEDHDGYKTDVDCDDNDATVHPDADEVCDTIDNNCNDEVDEGFDADGDTYLDAEQCDFGTDCDDNDAEIHPDATDIPYDGIDQDCSGADSADVDGDGYDAESAGGDDCDDDNADINPAAEDIPKNGVDEDCDGEDNIDGDADGFGDEALGGSDCDDEDPTVNPDATDWLNDGEDSNCDGPDGDEVDLDDVSAMIYGYLDSSTGIPDYAAYDIDICDIDDDGLGDVIVGAPFADTYNGQVGIFYGSGVTSWTNAMPVNTADSLISGDDYDFIGWSVACGDHNGDGYTDLAVTTGEILYADLDMDKDMRVLVYYGNGAPLPATLGDADADFVLNAKYDVPDAGSVYSGRSSFYDLDGDGADEILMVYSNDAGSRFNGEQRALVIPGGANSGEIDLEDLASHGYAPTQDQTLVRMQGTEDLDGDGMAEIFLTAPFHSDGNNLSSGAVFAISQSSNTGALDADLTTSATSSILGAGEDFLFGYRVAEDDFDGDGISDLVVTALGDSTDEAPNVGGLFAFSNAGDDMGTTGADANTFSDGRVHGNDENGYFGYNIEPVGDINGNGNNDLLVSEVYGGVSGSGFVWLIDGSDLWSDMEASDVAIYGWYASTSNSEVGYSIAGGHDIDGDGINDMAIGSLGYDNGAGRVEILLSGDL
jgi:hypothetical protein